MARQLIMTLFYDYHDIQSSSSNIPCRGTVVVTVSIEVSRGTYSML